LLQSEVHQKQAAQNYERPTELALRTAKYAAPEIIPIKVNTYFERSETLKSNESAGYHVGLMYQLILS
jgi:hypothetical protein